MRILVNALATSLLMVGSTAPSFAQNSNGPIVTIFRGGTAPTAATNSPGLAAPRAANGVTVMTGMPIVSPTPQQTAQLPGAALATGNGAAANAGLAAGATNPSGNSAMGNAALGAGAGMSGGTIASPIRGGFARPTGGGGRGGFGFK